MNNKIKIAASVLNVLVGAAALVVSILISENLDTNRAAFAVTVGVAAFLITLYTSIILDVSTGSYKCERCGNLFVPTFGAYIFGMHTITRRYLTCPHCGEKSFCRRKLD